MTKGNIMDLFYDIETTMRHEHEGSESSREELEDRLDKCKLFHDHVYHQGWFRNFKKKLQDKGLKLKKPEPIAVSEAESEAEVTQWFVDRMAYFIDKNLTDIIADPTRMFSLDETFVKFSDTKSYVLACAKQGEKKTFF